MDHGDEDMLLDSDGEFSSQHFVSESDILLDVLLDGAKLDLFSEVYSECRHQELGGYVRNGNIVDRPESPRSVMDISKYY